MSILGTLGAIGAAGSLGAGAIQAGASGKALTAEQQQQQEAINFLNSAYGSALTDIAPYQQTGNVATTSLRNLMSVPGQGLLQPWTQQFKAPTLAEAEEMPGYQFALQQGEQALQNSAAARGDLLSSGTQKNLAQFANQAGEQNYQDVYNNALQQYMQSYNQFQQNQSNTYNRLFSVANEGQNAAIQAGDFGLNAANIRSNLALQGGQQQAQQIQNRGGALASGLAGATNNLSNLGALMYLNRQNTQNNQPYMSPGGLSLPGGPVPFQGALQDPMIPSNAQPTFNDSSYRPV